MREIFDRKECLWKTYERNNLISFCINEKFSVEYVNTWEQDQNIQLKMLFLLSNTTKVRNHDNTMRFIFFRDDKDNLFDQKRLLFKKSLKKTFVAKVRHKKVKGILVIWVSDQKCLSVSFMYFYVVLDRKMLKKTHQKWENHDRLLYKQKDAFFQALPHKRRGYEICAFSSTLGKESRKWLFTTKSG